MRINAIGADYAVRNAKSVKRNNTVTPEMQTPTLPQGYSMISFRSGNPRHIAHMVSEEPIFGLKGGGVGTVSNDYNFLDKDVDKIVKLIPLYNQEVEYKADVDPKTGKAKHPMGQGVKVRYIPQNLPADHPFKGKEGSPFITSQALDNATDLTKFLETQKKSVFLLEEVKSGDMSWGFEEKTPIKMFKAVKDENLTSAMDRNGMSKDLQNKLEFVFTHVDTTASMPKPYADGMSYSSLTGSDIEKRFASGWQGQPYAKEAKATVELLPGLKEKFNIDPKYILCSDGQPMFAMHYAAQKNAAGDAYWKDKFLGGVGHNMNAGYDQPMGARQAIVNLGATKEELTKLLNSKEYIDAVKLGEEESFLRKTVLKDFVRPKSGMNAFNVAIHYAKMGYSPMLTTVSEGYHQSLITNPLVSNMYADLVELDKIGRFKGITNPLMDPNVSPFKDSIFLPGFKEGVKLKLANGSSVTINKLQHFEKDKCDLKTVRGIKQQNKINLLERFDSKFINAEILDKDGKVVGKPNQGRMKILTGLPNKDAKIYGEISSDYISKLKSGKDVKLVVSWGRGDLQKGMDTVLDTFEKYVEKHPNDNTVLLLGGPMENEEAQKVVEKFKLMDSKPKLHGRMIFSEGWAPGTSWAMCADAALLPSRFAPCELTDLEAKKALCTPIVPNVQGMAQKNFDPSIAEEVLKMDAYKGKHEFYMTEETALSVASEEAKANFNKTKNSLINEISKKYKGQVNQDIPEELLKESLEGNPKYTKALKNLRDSVISDELADCMERALITDRNNKNAETILANQVKADTTWLGNAWMSKTGKSSGQLYFDYHFNNKGKNISNNELIKLDFSGLHTNGEGGNHVHFTGKAKKIAAAALGVAALAGLGVAGYKQGWFSSIHKEENVKEEKNGSLSAIV